MSGCSTPSFKLSRTTTLVQPPKRRKAFSWSSAQTRALERHTNWRTDLRLQPRVSTNSRVRRYLPLRRLTHHWSSSVIDLAFFSWGSEDDPRGLWPLRSAHLPHKALHGLVSVGKAMIGNQVLPDGHGIPATTESLLDQLAVWFAGTDGTILGARRRRIRLTRVGGHPYGRFCRCSSSPPGQAHHYPG